MLDLLIVVLVAVAGYAGYRLGFVARVVSWVGMVVGLVLGLLIVPTALDAVARGNAAAAMLVASGLVLGGAGLGLAGGLLAAQRTSYSPRAESARIADHAGGAVMGVLGVLLLVWLLVPGLADLPGWPARAVRGSQIAQALAEGLPAAPDATQQLRRALADRSPQIFEGLERSPSAGAVPTDSGLAESTVDRVAPSVVKVVGRSCGSVESGTGWIVQPGTVVTNAHVVAGQTSLTLETSTGRTVSAYVVAIDLNVDLAIVAAPELDGTGLEMASTEVGTTGSAFGHPAGRPLELSPFRIANRIKADGRDIYGNPGVTRDLVVLAADIEPGDSGAPLIDKDGHVVGVAFATAPDRDGVAYAIGTDVVDRVLATVMSTAIDPGPCI